MIMKNNNTCINNRNNDYEKKNEIKKRASRNELSKISLRDSKKGKD